MRAHRILWCLLVVPLAVGFLGMGCEEDDDEETSASEGVGTNAPPPPAAQQTLKAGATTIGTDSLFNSGDVTAPGAGTIVARMEWDEAVQITAYFKKSGPANYGWVQGDSVLTSTIDPVAQNDVYTLYIYNSSMATDVEMDYSITFVPD